jgi:hypothetical protein
MLQPRLRRFTGCGGDCQGFGARAAYSRRAPSEGVTMKVTGCG